MPLYRKNSDVFPKMFNPGIQQLLTHGKLTCQLQTKHSFCFKKQKKVFGPHSEFNTDLASSLTNICYITKDMQLKKQNLKKNTTLNKKRNGSSIFFRQWGAKRSGEKYRYIWLREPVFWMELGFKRKTKGNGVFCPIRDIITVFNLTLVN